MKSCMRGGVCFLGLETSWVIMDEQEFEAHKARLERMHAIERLTDAGSKAPRVCVEKNFTFSEHAASLFREQIAVLCEAAHPKLTQSQLIELLIWHWCEHPPNSREVLNFDFVTKRGRPRASS